MPASGRYSVETPAKALSSKRAIIGLEAAMQRLSPPKIKSCRLAHAPHAAAECNMACHRAFGMRGMAIGAHQDGADVAGHEISQLLT